MKYNAAFFGTHETYFLVLKEKYGEDVALKIFQEVMERNLKKAYGTGFKMGDPKAFARVVGNRDKTVGLKVGFKIDGNEIIYRFYTDPFPNLKGKVCHEKLDDTYMAFKVRYLLGSWKYRNTKHIWDGDKYTEFVIEKK